MSRAARNQGFEEYYVLTDAGWAKLVQAVKARAGGRLTFSNFGVDRRTASKIYNRKSDVRLTSLTDTFRALGLQLVAGKDYTPVGTKALPPPNNLPCRNDYFTGRETQLQLLRAAGAQTGGRGRHVIRGAGGMGKTALVVEYAWRCMSNAPGYPRYTAFLFTHADTESEMAAGFAKIAEQVMPKTKRISDLERKAAMALDWLNMPENGPWLLVLDNADKLKIVKAFFKQHSWSGTQGHMLITTRSRENLGIRVLPLTSLDREESIRFLFDRTQREPNRFSATEHQATLEIAQELDGLPLALEQAGAFITRKEITFADYLALYRRDCHELLAKQNPETGDYPHTVFTAWRLNFQDIASISAYCEQLLQFFAFLHPDAIPERLSTMGALAFPNPLRAVFASQPTTEEKHEAYLNIVALIIAYSLVEKEVTGGTEGMVRMHRLIQLAIRHQMSGTQQAQWQVAVVHAINLAFPAPDFATWPDCESLLPHARVCWNYVREQNLSFVGAAQLLNKMARYLHLRGRYADVVTLHLEALVICEAQPEPDNADTAQVCNDLAFHYYIRLQFEDSERLHNRALAIRNRLFGEDHPTTADSLHNLGMLYRAQDRFPDGIAMYQRAFAVREKHLGKDHPDTARTLNFMGICHHELGETAIAEDCYRRAIAIEEALPAPNPLSLAKYRCDLGLVLRDRGEVAKAQRLMVRSFYDVRREVGLYHPRVGMALNGLGLLAAAQGRYRLACAFYRRSLHVLSKVFNPDYPFLANIWLDMAQTYSAEGAEANAQEAQRQAARITAMEAARTVRKSVPTSG